MHRHEPHRFPFLASALLAVAMVAEAPGTPGAESPTAATAAKAQASAAAPAILDDDPSALLGLGLVESFARFGPPSSVYSLRGDEPWQDDVAFVYGTGYTLFMYGDRLWQLRFTKPYAGSILGLFLGDGSDKALSILGQPYENGPGYLVYRMPFKSYPVRLRLALQDDRIVDAYLFRADF
jgi:hypothetical protein